MRPVDFIALTWDIDMAPQQDWACKATRDMRIQFYTDPNSPTDIRVTATNSKYSSAWDAVLLKYDEKSDQYGGIMLDSAQAYRYVTISFDRTGSASPRIHCYVSERYPARGPVPDDGSWTAGGHR